MKTCYKCGAQINASSELVRIVKTKNKAKLDSSEDTKFHLVSMGDTVEFALKLIKAGDVIKALKPLVVLDKSSDLPDYIDALIRLANQGDSEHVEYIDSFKEGLMWVIRETFIEKTVKYIIQNNSLLLPEYWIMIYEEGSATEQEKKLYEEITGFTT